MDQEMETSQYSLAHNSLTHSSNEIIISLIELYAYYGIAAATVVLSCLLIRLFFGVSPFELLRTRFYEVPPLRLTFRAMHLCLWALTIVSLLIGLAQGAGCLAEYRQENLIAATIAGVLWLLFAVSTSIFHYCFVRITDQSIPQVSVRHVQLGRRLPARSFRKIGCRQFPQMIEFGHTGGLVVRRGLSLITIALVAVAITACTDWARDNGLQDVCLGVIETLREQTCPMPQSWSVMLTLSCGLALILMYFYNLSYTLMSFSRTLLVSGVLGLGLLNGLATTAMSNQELAATVVTGLFVWSWRWAGDLNRAKNYRRVRDAKTPIQALLNNQVKFLPELRKHPDYQLADIDEYELENRISQGCKNVQEMDGLVTRNFARFFSLVRVNYEACAMAMMRFLTVRRYLSWNCAGGTSCGCRERSVPLWDEQIFPVHAPDGFVNWQDPLALGSEWDVVRICGGCGGCGQVSCGGCGGRGYTEMPQSHTEYNNGQSQMVTRYVRQTCGGCGGSGRQRCGSCQGWGRLLFHQVLVTQWQRLLPACVDPGTHIPDFMEDAEEQVHFRLPYIENRQELVLPGAEEFAANAVERKMVQTAIDLAASLPDTTALVEKLHEGKIYRADFQVAGFWTLGIKFTGLPGKIGWFFGSRPEFHFPALPLSWGKVGTVWFVLPFLLMNVVLGSALLSQFLFEILPSLPKAD